MCLFTALDDYRDCLFYLSHLSDPGMSIFNKKTQAKTGSSFWCVFLVSRVCRVVLCCVVLCCVMLCRVRLCYVVLCFVVLCGFVLEAFFDHFGYHFDDIFDVLFVSIFGHVFDVSRVET